MSKTKHQLPPHGKTVYPWKRWMDGDTHKAAKGKNFKSEVETFRRFLFVKAKNAGMSVETRVRGNVVYFQFAAKAK